MDKNERLELISQFENAYSAIDALIAGLSQEARRFVPPVKDAWSIDETLVHLLDADMSLWFRIRMAIAQPGFPIPAWDQEAWKSRLRYADEDGPACLGEAKSVRRHAAAFLKRFADEDWEGYYVQHPERGPLKLADLLAIYRDHISFHVPYVKRNLDALKAASEH